jgi:predicted DNA-binding WGR domain protein
MAKRVQVTSVTPAIKVKAISKAKQASTRKLVGAIASVTPVGKVVKVAGTAAKAATKVNSAKRANTRALKAANKNVAIKYKKGYNENNYSGRNESKPKQVAKSKVRSTSNIKAPMTQPSSYKEAKGAFNAFVKKNPEVAKKVDPNPKFGAKISRSAKENKKLSKVNNKSK